MSAVQANEAPLAGSELSLPEFTFGLADEG
jgi:hypothetical protein